MPLLLKIVSVFIFCIASIAMLFSAFLSSSIENSESFVIDFFEDYSIDENEDMSYRYISERESYYSGLNSDTEHVIEDDDTHLRLTLVENDRILTSFYNPLKNYILTGNGFTLEQQGIGEIYIDMLSRQNRYFIKPITTAVKLSFTSPDGDEIYNSIYLYPGQYIVFDPARNSFYTNADIARMQILTDIGYLSDYKDTPERLSVFIGEESIYRRYVREIEEKQIYYTKKSQELIELEISNLSSVSRIERYFLIFFNPEKKRAYYQNRIIESYMSLIASASVDRVKIAEISRYLGLLREINTEAYEESRNTLASFNSLMFRNHNPQNIISNVSLSLIEDQRETTQDFLFFAFYSFATSHSVHTTRGEEKLIKNYIESFLSYFGDNITAMQYFSYLLQEKTLELLGGPQNIDHSYILLYLGEYIRISQISFASTILEKKSLLYIYQNLIELLEIYLSETFFLNERTQTDLLVLKRDINLNSQDFLTLRQHIFSLLAYYTNNSHLLDSTVLRDSSLQVSLIQKSGLLREYLAALANYEAYTLEFDIVSRELLDRGIGNTVSEIISERSVTQYLSQFQGLGLNNLQIDIQDDLQVKIRGISVSGRSLAFTLLPLAGNRIRDIIIDGDDLIFEYPLDAIESDWEEKMRTASDAEKDRFDFRRFFLITLIEDRRDVGRDIVTENIQSQEEDRVIAVFKREVLLSPNGEFSSLAHIMQFMYNDIVVTRRDDTFDIFLDTIGLRIQPRESRNNRVYNGFFSSEYILTDESRSFKDMKLQFYEDIERSERTVLGHNKLHIVGEIPLTEIGSVLEDIADNLTHIFLIVNTLEQRGVSGEISLQYFPSNKNLRIRFDFGGERHTIVYTSSEIQSYIRGRQRIITNPTPVINLVNYLP